jgi:hypothetical protein
MGQISNRTSRQEPAGGFAPSRPMVARRTCKAHKTFRRLTLFRYGHAAAIGILVHGCLLLD